MSELSEKQARLVEAREVVERLEYEVDELKHRENASAGRLFGHAIVIRTREGRPDLPVPLKMGGGPYRAEIDLDELERRINFAFVRCQL